jgi:hypothetical protein
MEGYMSDRAQVFALCGKVLLQVFNKRPEDVKKEELLPVTEARKHTLDIVCELAGAGQDGTRIGIAQHIKAALSDLHPSMNYNCNEKLIRDLGEICATFWTVENGGERSSRELVFEAKFFCDHMKDELTNFKPA